MSELTEANLYEKVRKEWDDRFQSQRKMNTLYTYITGVSLAIGLAGTGFGIYASINSRFIPYVVAVDKIGHATVAPSPKRVGDWPPAVIRRELADFISNIRTITPDLDMLRQQQDAAAALLEPSSAAYNKIAAYMRRPDHQPIELAKTETVSPQITSVNYLGGTTWQVQWFETAYDRRNGKQISRKSYTATMVLAFHPITDSGTLELNPLGLFITEIDMQENNG